MEKVLLRAIDDLGAPERMARAARADAEARYARDRRLDDVLATLDWR